MYSKEFVNTYTSWNIAFVFRNFPTRRYLVLPKLLIPATLCSTPEYYFASRVISLWLTLNFISILRMKKLIIDEPPTNRESLLSIFGKNNFLYAKEVLLKNAVDLDTLYEEQIHHTLAITNYLKAIRLLIS